MWPWDACWLPALDAHKKGLRGFGMVFRALQPLMWPWDAGWLRMPGERHAGPPRRRDGSGLRVAILPALDAHEKPLMWPWDACCH